MSRFSLLAVFVVVSVCAVGSSFGRHSSVVFGSEEMTPVLLDVQDAPIPFQGSDATTHLVYELGMRNFSSGDVTIEQVEILGDGSALDSLNSAQVASRLQPYGKREAAAVLSSGASAILFIHVTLPEGQKPPKKLSHRVHLRAEAAPPGHQELVENGGDVIVDTQPVIVIGPPLRGDGYISADSCCDASRHTRAALPVNGRIWLAQRFAVDWEQLDSSGRIYHGPQTEVSSYTIYGKEALAVANAKVASVIDNLPNQTPSQYPTNIPIEEADGNSVVLDLGGGRYCLYAHLQAGKIRVHAGDTVKRGQVLGLVGNSGNSVAPHLHFHVMSTPTPLASNGLPYEIDSFRVTGATPGTHAFDEAEEKGTPLAVTSFSPPKPVSNGLPLDQLVISFQP
jgi:Peptidase family M23